MSVNWRKVTEAITRRKVIPVLGCDALPVIVDGRKGAFHQLLAEDLRCRLDAEGLPVPATAQSLSQFVREYCAHSSRRDSDRRKVIGRLREHLLPAHAELLERAVIAPECMALKAFQHLPLIVTTAVDGFVEKALRGAGVTKPTLVNHDTRLTVKSLADIPDIHTRAASEPPLLYHLFGLAHQEDTFGLTDDEWVEIFWKLLGQARDSKKPENLVNALEHEDYSILLLGSSFPDWFLRFLVRLVRGAAFMKSTEDSFQILAEQQLCEGESCLDANLRSFLSQFDSSNLWIYQDLHPWSFLKQLEEQWSHRTSTSAATAPFADESGGRHLFISYASEDAATARALSTALKDRCEVWFDEDRLSGGEPLSADIARAIEDADLFIPLISKSTNAAATARIFVEEWQHAIQKARKIQTDIRKFIVPVIVDDLSESDVRGIARTMKEHPLNLKFLRHRDGVDALVAQILSSYRAVQVAIANQHKP